MQRWRLAALLLVVLALTPGTWWRAEPPAPVPGEALAVPLEASTPPGWPEGLVVEAAWHLQSSDPAFSGFSALVVDGTGALIGLTDGGAMARFSPPPIGKSQRLDLAISPLPPDPAIRYLPDVESAVRDPASGTLWLGYEQHHVIRRISPDGRSALVRPPAMQGWGSNSGPEAMARLPDGRFIVLAERAREGLLFAGDPTEAGEPLRFTLDLPGRFLPVDMGILPDGRALVLLRATRWALPPFASMLALADPATIRAGEPWRLEPLARIEGHDLVDNHEGLAITPQEDGSLVLWVISDDNRSVLQRTLLLRLRWRPGPS